MNLSKISLCILILIFGNLFHLKCQNEQTKKLGNRVNSEQRRIYDKTYTNYLVAQDHIDLCWWFDWQRAVKDVTVTTERQLALLKSNSDYKFMFPQAQVYQWLQEYRPDLFHEIKSYVDEGRWEISGAQWCEPDNTVPSGETATRNFLIGKRYFREKFNKDIKIGYLPDSFGHIWTYPQILKLSGIDFFVETKLDDNAITKVPYLCNWKSPDGSGILTCNTFLYAGHVYGTRLRGYENYPRVVDYMNRTMDRAMTVGMNKAVRTFSQIGDNSGGPDQNELDSVRSANKSNGSPLALFATFQDYFQAIKSDKKTDNIPSWNDELYVDSRRGVWTCGAAEKYYRRKNDIKIEVAEKLASISYSLGATDYPVDKLNRAWEYICLLTNHDHSNGTWCNNTAYNRTLRTFGITSNLLDETQDYTFDAIASRANTHVGKGNVPVIVFNPLSWERNDVVETKVVFDKNVSYIKVFDDRNREVPSQVKSISGKEAVIIFEANQIPGTGFKVFKVTPSTVEKTYSTGLEIKGNKVENNYLKAELNRLTGNFTSVYLKSDAWEALKQGSEANELHLLKDSRNSRDLDQKEMEASPYLVNNVSEIEVLESGPVRAVFRFRKSTPSGSTSGSSIVQNIVMYSNLNRIDIKNDIDWNEQFKMLKVSFPLNVSPDSCTYEIPFGNISRPVKRNTPETATKFEVYGHKWADMSNDGFGVSIFNDSKYGWDALDNRLRLSLFKSSNDKDTRFEKGRYETTYSIYPHKGGWQSAETVKKANEMNYPVIAKQVSVNNGKLGRKYSFVEVDQPNVMITAIKKSEDYPSDLIIRLVEINGIPFTECKLSFRGPVNNAVTVNLIEDSLDLAKFSKNILYTNLHQYEVKSFKISISELNYKNTQPGHTKIDLSSYYNLDGISSNSSRFDGNIDGKGNSFSSELMPGTIISEDIPFSIGNTEAGAKNIIECKGQTINLPAGKYSSIQFIAMAAGGDVSEKGTFKINYPKGDESSKTVFIRDWIAEFYDLQADLKGWNTPINENIAYVLSHRHTPVYDDTCRTNYIFKYSIPLDSSGEVQSLSLPTNNKIKIIAITLVNSPVNPSSQLSEYRKNFSSDDSRKDVKKRDYRSDTLLNPIQSNKYLANIHK